MRRKALLVVAVGLLGRICFAQGFDKEKLDSYFNSLQVNNKFMGSVAVSQNGRIIYSNSVGFSDIETKSLANENSKYRIGSNSKTFTAVLVFKAIEEGKISLSNTIDKYFPAIKNANKITILHLLYHRSGIHNFTDGQDYSSWKTIAKTENEMLEIIVKSGADFEPGSKAEYSNSNYVLLSYILEKNFKKPYAQLLEEYIAKPIGLSNTFLGGKINTKNQECKSYSFVDKWKLEAETDISIPLGAGGIVSTASDMVRFSDALFNGKLIKKESFEQMKSMKENFGAGLFKISFDSISGLGNKGGIDGFSSVIANFPNQGISFALVSNATNYNNNDISITVLSAILNRPYSLPEFTSLTISSEDLDKYVGVYSSSQIPLKITIRKNNKTMLAQATGQAEFPLEATEKDKFKFDKAGVILEFNPTEKTMVLKQGGKQFSFMKE